MWTKMCDKYNPLLHYVFNRFYIIYHNFNLKRVFLGYALLNNWQNALKFKYRNTPKNS